VPAVDATGEHVPIVKGDTMTFKQVSRKLAILGTVATLGLGALPALGAAPANTDLPRSVGELMNMTPMQVMQMMDPEHKGMVTKEQYLKFFSDLWDRMDADKKGMVMKDTFMYGWAERHK
jgi:hypothetical protein